MDRVAIFIDAAYLRKTLEIEFRSQKIDFGKLVEHVAGTKEILRSYYYDCAPYQSDPPTQEKKRDSAAPKSSFTRWTKYHDSR